MKAIKITCTVTYEIETDLETMTSEEFQRAKELVREAFDEGSSSHPFYGLADNWTCVTKKVAVR